jgi:predicted MFS family arabinose efflux permease
MRGEEYPGLSDATQQEPKPGKLKVVSETFRALRYTGYRYMWLGQMGHSAAMWMEQVVRPLLILEMTGSALQVGLVISVRMIPQFVFGLLAGVIADRYNKQRVLIVSQSFTMAMHLTLAVLVLSGHIQIWHIFVTAFISGGSMAFNQPARQSLVPRLVPPDTLLNALALNTAAMNIMRVAGASLAGVLLLFLDYGQIYLLNAILFVGVIWTTTQLRVWQGASPGGAPPPAGTPRERRSFLGDFGEGFRYVFSNRKLLYLVGMALVLFILGQPYQQVFIPLIALDVLKIGRSGAGLMLALTGVGALIGSLIVASRKSLHHRGLTMMGSLVVFGLALVLLAQSRWIPLSALALVAAGGMVTTYNALNTSLLLENSPPEFHGRVMSLMSLDRGLVSVGAILSGALAEAWGPQAGLTTVALACVVVTVLLFLLVPALRRI